MYTCCMLLASSVHFSVALQNTGMSSLIFGHIAQAARCITAQRSMRTPTHGLSSTSVGGRYTLREEIDFGTALFSTENADRDYSWEGYRMYVLDAASNND